MPPKMCNNFFFSLSFLFLCPLFRKERTCFEAKETRGDDWVSAWEKEIEERREKERRSWKVVALRVHSWSSPWALLPIFSPKILPLTSPDCVAGILVINQRSFVYTELTRILEWVLTEHWSGNPDFCKRRQALDKETNYCGDGDGNVGMGMWM